MMDPPEIDDRDACLVYADWLIEQGDPLGELMAEEIRQGKSGRRLDYLRAHFSPEIVREESTTWKNGLVERLVVSTHKSIEAVKSIAATRGVQSLRELEFSVQQKARGWLDQSGAPMDWVPEPTEPTDFPPDPIPTFVEYPLPKSLRKLQLRLSFNIDDPKVLQFDLNLLYPQLSQLEELNMSVFFGSLGTLDLPALRALQTSYVNEQFIAELNRAKLPKLTHLTFEYAMWSKLNLVAIESATNLQRLKLISRVNPLLDANYRPLAASPLVQRVRSLSLDIGEGDAERIAAIAPWLGHLEELGIRGWTAEVMTHAREVLTPIFGARLKVE